MKTRLIDIYRVNLNSKRIRNKHVFDFSCFRSKTEHWYNHPQMTEPILVAVTFYKYVLQPDVNGFQGKKETLYHLTDVVGTVDCVWKAENPNDNNPPLEMIASEDVDGTNQNHVFFDSDEAVLISMSDGQIGTLEEEVRKQLLQVLMKTVKNPIIKDMIISIIGWYKFEYDLFRELGYDIMLTKMQEDIDNLVTERTDILLFKPFESVVGHPIQNNTIFDNIKARFDAYKTFINNNQ